MCRHSAKLKRGNLVCRHCGAIYQWLVGGARWTGGIADTAIAGGNCQGRIE